MSTLVTVRAYLNSTYGPHGIPIGMLSGYEPGHELELAFEASVAAAPDLAICEEIFRLLNVGDDPEFGLPDLRALAYRAQGHRSLSVGDLVTVENRAYACARVGFVAVALPSQSPDATAL
jgi:hypothetical protein